jgi:hypothetical protein
MIVVTRRVALPHCAALGRDPSSRLSTARRFVDNLMWLDLLENKGFRV